MNQLVNTRLNNYIDFGHRAAIFLTGWLPLSTRSILVRIISAPFLIPLRLFQSWGPEFSKKMSDYLIQDWTGGITDFYIDLKAKENSELRKKLYKANYCYAAYMYAGLQRTFGNFKSKPDNHFMISDAPFPSDLDSKVKDTLTKVRENLLKMGFKGNYNYYHEETNTCFNLVYDYEKKEVVMCFMGLNGINNIANATGEKIGASNTELWALAAFDWIGGHPAASLQAIQIGKMMQEVTQGTEITPVMVGHSHGGGIAQVAAAANGLKSVVFNSRPMGAGMRRYIGQSTIAKNAKNMIVFSTKGDWLTGNTIINVIAVLFERIIGITVPRNIGLGYQLPSADHEEFYSSMNGLINFKYRPANIVYKWLKNLFGSVYGDSLFQFIPNQDPLEVEVINFNRKLNVSSYLDFRTDKKDWLSELKKKHPQINFEYPDFKYGPIQLRCLKNIDFDGIRDENHFKEILLNFDEEVSDIYKCIESFSSNCGKWNPIEEGPDFMKNYYLRSSYIHITRIVRAIGGKLIKA